MSLSRRSLLRLSPIALTAAMGVPGQGEATTLSAQVSAMQSGGSNQRLQELASFIPLSELADNVSNGGELLTYGDSALRLEQTGVDLTTIAEPTERAKAFVRATMPVPFADLVLATVKTDDPNALLGWTMFEIDQNASVMSTSGRLTVLHGRFDSDQLQRTWQQQGYQISQNGAATVASRSPDGQLDLTSELGRLTLAAANNAALVGDATLIYAPTLEALDSMILASRGEIESLSALPAMTQTIEAAPSALAGAMLLPAGGFAAPPDIMLQDSATVSASEPGPVPLVGLVGFSSGPAVPAADLGTDSQNAVPSGSAQVAVRSFLGESELTPAAKRSLLILESQANPQTGQPWREIFPDWQVSVDVERSAVLTDIALFANESIWIQLILTRQASFLYG